MTQKSNSTPLPQTTIAPAIRVFFVSTMKVTVRLPGYHLLRNIAISVLLTGFTLVLLFIAQKTKVIRFSLPVLLILVTVGSAWYFSNKSYYFGERQFVYPPNPITTELENIAGLDRIGFANDDSRIRSASNVIYGLYSPEGLNPVFALRYGQLIASAANGGQLTNQIPRISVIVDLERAHADPSTAPRLNKLMSLLDMKYIVERKESGWYKQVFPDQIPVWENTNFRIWENPDTLPRAFVATDINTITDPQKILDAIYSVNLQNTAIVDEPISLSQPTNTNTSVSITSYNMNNLTMTVHSSTSGLLVLTDTYAPGWHAMVDGKEVPILRTDFTFRGVPISAGNHHVIMYYWPKSLTLGIWAMGGGILLLLGSLFVIRWKLLT